MKRLEGKTAIVTGGAQGIMTPMMRQSNPENSSFDEERFLKLGDTSTVAVVVRGENLLEKSLRFDERDHDIVFDGEQNAALTGGIRVEPETEVMRH